MAKVREKLLSGRLFDGRILHPFGALLLANGSIKACFTKGEKLPAIGDHQHFDNGVLAPGLVDLQVNGGDGLMFNEQPTQETLARLCDCHGHLGSTALLPTLISDHPSCTAAALTAVQQGLQQGLPGLLGIHLEGPHLAPERAGIHRQEHLRAMRDSDCQTLIAAKKTLPVLLLTVAVEAVQPAQVRALRNAGVVVSLGHSNSSEEQANAYVRAGVRAVTHLFNAMAPFHHRAAGLVGAALNNRRLYAGLIADGQHLCASAVAASCRAKRPTNRLFLVSDAMASVGSNRPCFRLQGQLIQRHQGRLIDDNGTLAGADKPLVSALRFVVKKAAVALPTALQMATRNAARCVYAARCCGQLRPGMRADIIHLDDSLQLRQVWRHGEALHPHS